MPGILYLGPDSSQNRNNFAIVYLGNTWTLTRDLEQGDVDAVEWLMHKSVGFIVRQPDSRTTCLQVETASKSSTIDG